MLISKIMNRHLIFAGRDKTLIEIDSLMEKHKIEHLLVMEGGRLEGIITQKEVNRFKNTENKEIKANDIMQKNPVSVSENQTIQEALELMLKHHVHALPVIKEGSYIAGIVTTTDFLKYLSRILETVG